MLDRRAPGKLAKVTVRSSRGACVLHRRGRLVIQHCSLELDTAGGLSHLFAPIVTTAAGVLGGRGEEIRTQGGTGGSAVSSAGILLVSETRIQVNI